MFKKFFVATLGIGFALAALILLSYGVFIGGAFAVARYETYKIQKAERAECEQSKVEARALLAQAEAFNTSHAFAKPTSTVRGVPEGLTEEDIPHPTAGTERANSDPYAEFQTPPKYTRVPITKAGPALTADGLVWVFSDGATEPLSLFIETQQATVDKLCD